MHFSHLIMMNAGGQRKKKPEVIGDEVSVYADNYPCSASIGYIRTRHS